MPLKRKTFQMFSAMTTICAILFVGQSKGASIPREEMKDFVDQRIENNEENKKRCERGEYWSHVVKECESCDKCPNGEDILSCGYECREYFDFKNLEENQSETDAKLAQILQERNYFIASSAVFLFLIFLIILYLVVEHLRSSKKKETPSQTPDQKEMTPSASNAQGNQNTQVNIQMTSVTSGAEGGRVASSNNKQDESVTSSLSTISEEPIRFNNAKPFATDCEEGGQESTREYANAHNNATDTESNEDGERDTSITTVPKDTNEKNKAVPCNTNGEQHRTSTTSRVKVIVEAKAHNESSTCGLSFEQNSSSETVVRDANTGNEHSNHGGNQGVQLSNSSTTVIENLDSDNEETTPVNPESDRTEDSKQAHLVEGNQMQRPRRQRKRSSS